MWCRTYNCNDIWIWLSGSSYIDKKYERFLTKLNFNKINLIIKVVSLHVLKAYAFSHKIPRLNSTVKIHYYERFMFGDYGKTTKDITSARTILKVKLKYK